MVFSRTLFGKRTHSQTNYRTPNKEHHNDTMSDAVDEDKLLLCCALCCANCSILPTSCIGCSGKIGLCCLNIELCCKPGAPCLCCCCCGPTCVDNGCSVCNAQVQCCCSVCNAALPCNEDVPVAVAVAGLMVYPKFGCCITQRVSLHWKILCYSFLFNRSSF